MRIPAAPPVGHLVAYEYLWRSRSGTDTDGRRTYPCAIVVAAEIGGRPLAYVLGLSHAKPRETDRALEVPLKLKRHLGLDDAPTWIYTDQLNIFAWPGPDLRPAERLSSRPDAAGTCVIGRLPDGWFDMVKAHLAESYRMRAVRPVSRSR